MYNARLVTHDFNPELMLHVLVSYLIGEKVSNNQKINCTSTIGSNEVGEHRAVSLMLGENGNFNSKVTEVNSLLCNICHEL